MFRTAIVLVFALHALPAARAAEPLVLDLDAEGDLLSLSHHIDQFLFAPTRNTAAGSDRDLNESMRVPEMKDYLAVTALVRIGGKVAGFATEQEVVRPDPATGMPVAESAWLITLNRPGLTGDIAVRQRENARGVMEVVQQVHGNPAGPWPDAWQRFLSTDGETRVQMATGDLARYQGGKFEEYNYLNAADPARFGHFRARIQFVIHAPGDAGAGK